MNIAYTTCCSGGKQLWFALHNNRHCILNIDLFGNSNGINSHEVIDGSFEGKLNLQGNTKFWYGVMKLVQTNILEAYAIIQLYSTIAVAAEIEYKVVKL